jgi:hypothetical protein
LQGFGEIASDEILAAAGRRADHKFHRPHGPASLLSFSRPSQGKQRRDSQHKYRHFGHYFLRLLRMRSPQKKAGSGPSPSQRTMADLTT